MANPARRVTSTSSPALQLLQRLVSFLQKFRKISSSAHDDVSGPPKIYLNLESSLAGGQESSLRSTPVSGSFIVCAGVFPPAPGPPTEPRLSALCITSTFKLARRVPRGLLHVLGNFWKISSFTRTCFLPPSPYLNPIANLEECQTPIVGFGKESENFIVCAASLSPTETATPRIARAAKGVTSTSSFVCPVFQHPSSPLRNIWNISSFARTFGRACQSPA